MTEEQEAAHCSTPAGACLRLWRSSFPRGCSTIAVSLRLDKRFREMRHFQSQEVLDQAIQPSKLYFVEQFMIIQLYNWVGYIYRAPHSLLPPDV